MPSLFLSAEDSDPFLLAELQRADPSCHPRLLSPGLLSADVSLTSNPHPTLAFARQWLPQAQPVHASSINAWADLLAAALAANLPETQPWHLHLFPHFATPNAGHNRCTLIREALRQRLLRKRRHLLRRCLPAPAPFTPDASLVQALLTSPEHGWLSIAPAPQPHSHRSLLSPFPAGHVPIASDKSAPCRAFAKLVEAEQRLGRPIAPGETCVDLGASPGSWTYVALQRDAHVIAVDRAPLRPDLMSHPRLHFHQGDAFSFVPSRPVDWLLCDVIAAPTRTLQLLHTWIQSRWTRRFVVTIKFKGAADYPLLDSLKTSLPDACHEFRLARLTANRNEACAFGELAPTP